MSYRDHPSHLPACGPMLSAVSKTLAAAGSNPLDAGLAMLIRAYAAELDMAEGRAARFDAVMAKLARLDEPDAWEALQAARGQLAARTTLDRIGGRLQSGLDALRATPKARPMDPPRAPMSSHLGRLRLAAGTDTEHGPAGHESDHHIDHTERISSDHPREDRRDERVAREFLSRQGPFADQTGDTAS
jgi:hypothetical protein